MMLPRILYQNRTVGATISVTEPSGSNSDSFSTASAGPDGDTRRECAACYWKRMDASGDEVKRIIAEKDAEIERLKKTLSRIHSDVHAALVGIGFFGEEWTAERQKKGGTK